MGTPRPRRATVEDTAALAALSPTSVPAIVPTDSPDRAVFVIDGPAGPRAAIDLAHQANHLSVEHLIADRRDTRRLLGHAQAAARALGLGEIRWSGFPGGIRRVRNGPLQRAGDHLDDLGVPLWRDGTASLAQSLYFRGTWASIALLIGLGSLPLAVFSGTEITWLHIAGPAILCLLGTAFTLWQIVLIAAAAHRTGSLLAFTATSAAAAATAVLVGALVYGRAVPAIAEMWAIHTGDVALDALAVSVSPDGSTLTVEGSYGTGSEEAVRRALQQNPNVRTVVLSGPGGRVSTGFDLYHLFRERKLATRVDKGCASACTFAFLGGVERSLAPGGRLGFHRASFPGMGDNDLYESNRDLRRFLIYGVRLTPEFVNRIFDTPPDEIWVPNQQELLAGRVITLVNR